MHSHDLKPNLKSYGMVNSCFRTAPTFVLVSKRLGIGVLVHERLTSIIAID